MKFIHILEVMTQDRPDFRRKLHRNMFPEMSPPNIFHCINNLPVKSNYFRLEVMQMFIERSIRILHVFNKTAPRHADTGQG
jgi:hypothetical protein